MRALARHALIDRVNADRITLERQGMQAALKFGSQARMHAYAAWRIHRDVRAVQMAIRDVLIGNQRLNLPGVKPLLTAAMVTSHLTGVKRTVLNVGSRLRVDGIKLSSTYDGAVDFLQRRLKLTPDEVASVETTYGQPAAKVINTATKALEAKVQESLLQSIQDGDGVAGGTQALREAFESEGFIPGADHQLQAVFRTQINSAYSAGRWQSLNDNAVTDLIWGFEYVAIEDDRTTPFCEKVDHTKLAKDDPFWQTNWPPNHYNCRSTTLELLDSDTEVAPPDDAGQPQAGFNFNPGQAYNGIISLRPDEPTILSLSPIGAGFTWN